MRIHAELAPRSSSPASAIAAHPLLALEKSRGGFGVKTSPDTLASTRRISAWVSGRALASKPPLHHFGGARQQFAKHVVGHIAAERNRLGEHAVMVGAAHKRGEAGLRNLRAGIAGELALHRKIAAPDQDVGHRLSIVGAARNRIEMLGAHRVCDFDEIGGAKPR